VWVPASSDRAIEYRVAIVDLELMRAVRAADDRAVRLFVSGCAERTAPLFGAIYANDQSRTTDIELLVETLDDLWNTDIGPDSLQRRQPELATLPEVADTGEEWTTSEETLAAHAVLAVLYAVAYVADGRWRSAMNCARVASGVYFAEDPDVENLYDAERALQFDMLRLLTDGARSVADLRAADRGIARARAGRILVSLSRREGREIDIPPGVGR
jgi:hypothetical protein